jgi:DNA-binding CsgD family transcriptional regulator
VDASLKAGSERLAELLGRPRSSVLRAASAICMLSAAGNLSGAILGYTPDGLVTGPAVLLAGCWCALWAAAAGLPELTARCFTRWLPCGLLLAAANSLTVGMTGGIESPDPAVCTYVGWVAAVVLAPRTVLAMSTMIAASTFAGYFVAGASGLDVFVGPHRFTAVSNALLPILAGWVAALLACLTSAIYSGLASRVLSLRAGMAATSPGLTALLGGGAVAELPAPSLSLTDAERSVVALLAAGHVPKQIAVMRGVELSTVRSQIKAAKRKTGARTLPELVLELGAAGGGSRSA